MAELIGKEDISRLFTEIGLTMESNPDPTDDPWMNATFTPEAIDYLINITPSTFQSVLQAMINYVNGDLSVIVGAYFIGGVRLGYNLHEQYHSAPTT